MLADAMYSYPIDHDGPGPTSLIKYLQYSGITGVKHWYPVWTWVTAGVTHWATVLTHRQNRQVLLKEPDEVDCGLDIQSQVKFMHGNPRVWDANCRRYLYYWTLCAVLKRTQFYCYQLNQSLSWMLADGIGLQAAVSLPSPSQRIFQPNKSAIHAAVFKGSGAQ